MQQHKKKNDFQRGKVKIVNKKRLLLNENIPFFIKLLILIAIPCPQAVFLIKSGLIDVDVGFFCTIPI
jgi:hypothetical protein